MSLRRYVVADVFARAPLEGNPVAVFLDATGLTAELMQRAARELALSETTFLLPPQDGDPERRVRIFTPAVELPFAGHPLIGTAFVLAAADPGLAAGSSRMILLQTGAGRIPVAVEERGEDGLYGRLEHRVPEPEPFPEAPALLGALGVGQTVLPVEAYRNGARHVYVSLGREEEVSDLAPDLTALARLGPIGVSCFAGSGSSFRTRMFAPALGVPEDPATGSAAGPLVVHLVRHGMVAPGDWIEIRQGEEIGRPSILHACLEGDPGDQHVAVGGSGFIVAHGEYRLG